MSVSVRYYSKSGNTEKLARVIAKAAECTAFSISEPLEEYSDILFLGASVYYGGISLQVKSFIRSLDKARIGKVAVFSTSSLAQRAFAQIKKELNKVGISVDENNFYCRGQFGMLHSGRPNEKDLKAAEAFAKKIIG